MQRTRLLFTPMKPADLPVIGELEQVCFPAPWPTSTYKYELSQNRLGRYAVIRPQRATPTSDPQLPPILAYGGYWLMGEQAHIVTIATHPEWRRRKLGEWLLLEMLAQARSLGAAEATLEVRVTNLAARALYTKLDFREEGRRRRYYRDNGEDALIFTLHDLDAGSVWRPLMQQLDALRETAAYIEI